MSPKWYSMIALITTAIFLFNVSNCGFNQHLTSISIAPSSFTYGSAAPANSGQTPIPLTAYGTYIHPPETKDITDQVIWASDTPVPVVVSTGHLTPGPHSRATTTSASLFTA